MTHKSSILVAAVTLAVAALSKLRAVYNRCFPVGYEDDGGFHPGSEPEL